MADGARTPPADGLAEGGAAGRAEAVDGLSRACVRGACGGSSAERPAMGSGCCPAARGHEARLSGAARRGAQPPKPFNIHIKHKYMYVHIFCLR